MAKHFLGATIFPGHGRISTPSTSLNLFNPPPPNHKPTGKHFLSLSESVKMGFTDFVSDSSLNYKTFITKLTGSTAIWKLWLTCFSSAEQLGQDAQLHCWVSAVISTLTVSFYCTNSVSWHSMMRNIGPCWWGGLRPRRMTITKALVVSLTPITAIVLDQYGSVFLTRSSTDKTQAILPPRPTPSAFKQLSHHPRSPNTLMLTAGIITSPPSNLSSPRSLAIHQSLTLLMAWSPVNLQWIQQRLLRKQKRKRTLTSSAAIMKRRMLKRQG